jgi:hypothetical protein
MEGREFNIFCWRFRNRSRHQYFTESTDLRGAIRAADLWSPLESIVNPRKRKLKLLEDADVSAQQNCSLVESSDQQGSMPSPAFCSRCARIDFGKIAPAAWNATSFRLGTFSCIGLESSCPLCNLFSSMVTKFVDDVTEDEWIFYLCPFYTSQIYGANWRWNPIGAGVDETISFAILDERTFREGSRVCQPEMIRATGWMSPTQTPGNFPKFNARLLNATVDFTVLRAWLDFCSLYHTRTCFSQDCRKMLSLRVIDCDNHIIVPAESGCQYLVLSYVWGTSTALPGEEGSDQGKGQLQIHLPRTIKDAILATKKLGYRYLWVDRYCIPQEDNNERRQQIYQMDLVYSRAQATIIAVAGEDPSFGLPGVGSRLRVPSVSATIANTSYAFVPADPAHEIHGSKWNSRGWTHQETVLSKRRLIFCEDQVYFECSGMHCYESMDMPLKALHIRNRQHFSKWNEPGIFTPATRRRQPLDEVFEQISQYTKRSLSHPEDILNGMMGILGTFENTYKSFLHYEGVPIVPDVTLAKEGSTRHSTRVEQFATSLCWKLNDPSLRRSGFPSWSWTGWHGVVSSLSGYGGYIENTYDIKFSVKLPDGRLMDWEGFCSSGNIGGNANSQKLSLYVDAAVVRIRFQHLQSDEPRRPGEYYSHLNALFETDDQSAARAACYLTQKMTGNGEVSQRLLTGQWYGIVLGTRYGTSLGRGQSRRTINTIQHEMVVMAVQVDGNIAERVGLIIFNTFIDIVDGVRIHFDLDRIPTTRHHMQLV